MPADGEVTAGHSYVDESMLTGEPAAVPKAPGNALMGGTLNAGGLLHMRTTRVGSDTALAHIVQVRPSALNQHGPLFGTPYTLPGRQVLLQTYADHMHVPAHVSSFDGAVLRTTVTALELSL